MHIQSRLDYFFSIKKENFENMAAKIRLPR